jgi:hypothetical protein
MVWKTVGKVIASPITIPYKILRGNPEEKRVIHTIVKTNRPDAYALYFNSLGHPCHYDGSKLIVFSKGISPKDKEKALAKMGEVI